MAYDWRFWVPTTFAALCVVWCVFIGVVAWVSPVMSETASASLASDGSSSASTTLAEKPFSAISQNGVWPLLIPILLALLALLAATARAWGLVAIAGMAFAAFVLLGSFSIGLFFVPAAALAFISAALGAILD
jgi:hypothetical protein